MPTRPFALSRSKGLPFLTNPGKASTTPNRFGRRTAATLLLLAGLVTAPALARTVVTSPGPDAVEITVYRDPDRSADAAIDLEWLDGFALIGETRTVTIPAGESEVRFEGVAGGIVPQSAIVTGFPDGIVERNRDAYLLSPATLLDRSLGRRVHLRRTSLATGAVREHEAVIRSSADGAVVLQTAAGFEALRCTGLAETLVHDEVPAALSARPTLSVRVRSSQPLTARVTLSYLATGFDWQANYIAQLSSDDRRIDLFAWLTLASSDETSFVDADTQAVAGRLNRRETPPQPREGGPLRLQCWPQGTTSDIPLDSFARMAPPPPPPAAAESVVVTGSRIQVANLTSYSPTAVMTAEQEELGDLKLYRIPEPVTVAANGQKQVALLARPGVEVRLVYRAWIDPEDVRGPRPARRYLVTRNREAEGLGVALPAGGFALFAEAGGRPILLGEGHVGDRAVGEEVEIDLGAAPGVASTIEQVREARRWTHYLLTVTNDRAAPVRFEAAFPDAGSAFRPERRLARRDGAPLWAVDIPANGSASLRYRVRNGR